MANILPTLPLPKDVNQVPYIGSQDNSGRLSVPSLVVIEKNGASTPVTPNDPLPIYAPEPLTVNSSLNNVIKSAPAVGAKTVTTTAAEIFAISSRRSNRYYMGIYNMDADNYIYIGPSGVTAANGFPVPPGAMIGLEFLPTLETAIYAVSNAPVAVRVVELA